MRKLVIIGHEPLEYPGLWNFTPNPPIYLDLSTFDNDIEVYIFLILPNIV